MDIKSLTLYGKYPFIENARQYVNQLGITEDKLLHSRALESARIRGKERVLQALTTTQIEKPFSMNIEEVELFRELISYPFAKIFISCINDSFLTRRYSLAEAKSCHLLLKKEPKDFLIKFSSSNFNMVIDSCDGSYFNIKFTDYIKNIGSLKSGKWKLTNRKLHKGQIRIIEGDFLRILQEAIRNKIQNSFSFEVQPSFCEHFKSYIDEIKEELEKQKRSFEIGDFGAVTKEAFPPCIVYAISNVSEGVNLSHTMRFALTSFLLKIGMSIENIIDIFNVSPDFDSEKTIYQLEHIAGATGTVYDPPACATMRSFGNCYNADKICKKIHHPLSYYREKQKTKIFLSHGHSKNIN